MEQRLLLSKVGPLADAGDQRWLYTLNQPGHLLRATDQVLVTFQPSSARRVRRLSTALTDRSAALAGYRVMQTFGDRYSVVFERTARGPAPTLDSLLQKIDGFPALKQLSPTFFSLPQWSRIVVFDSLYVHLRAGVDPAPVFQKGFRSDWSPAGVTNAYNATLKHGGAIDALRASEKLRTQPYIESVDVDMAVDVILSSTTPNANYTYGTGDTGNDPTG